MTTTPTDEQTATVTAADDDPIVPTCLVCGCTETTPCPGGCHWVPCSMAGALCSNCADADPSKLDAHPAGQGGFREWVVLELMGHRRLAGLLSEQQVAGATFLRLDIPPGPGRTQVSQLYRPEAVYCITPTTEAIARAIANRVGYQPVSRFELQPVPVISAADILDHPTDVADADEDPNGDGHPSPDWPDSARWP